MNMRMMVSSLLAGERAAVSTLLKPAVRGVTAEKKLTSTCSPRGMPTFMRSRSMKKKSAAPPKVRMAEVMSTSLVCRLQRRTRRAQLRMSSHTRKPMPPMVMSAMMVMLTSASPE